ncbi:MAG: hypothetical protein LBE18_01460 [Planctomycetaceae bacterium]|nr:hypothetical protein [Planctomycetaceae bacterium]
MIYKSNENTKETHNDMSNDYIRKIDNTGTTFVAYGGHNGLSVFHCWSNAGQDS